MRLYEAVRKKMSKVGAPYYTAPPWDPLFWPSVGLIAFQGKGHFSGHTGIRSTWVPPRKHGNLGVKSGPGGGGSSCRFGPLFSGFQ